MISRNPLNRLAVAALLLVAWPLSFTWSQSRTDQVDAAAEPCVLLQNGNVLFGRAHQVGEHVVVRTGATGEVRLPRSTVACWAGSLRDLYQYRKDHRLPADLRARLRDARWCLRYDLFDLVAEEIRAVRQVDPNNAEARRIEDQLRRMTAVPTHRSNVITQPPELQRVAFEESQVTADKVDPVVLRGFARHIQPMLLSRCGRCHNSAVRDSGWSLVVPTPGTRASARITRENLRSSLAHIDAGAPEHSELFLKASTPHGESGELLGSRNARAVESLRIWIAAASNAAPPRPAPPRPAPPIDDSRAAHEDSSEAVDSEPAVESAPEIQSRIEESEPERLPQVANPFDPEIFNRRFHMKTSGSQ